MITFQYVIQDEAGIHARPAGTLVKEAKKYNEKITIEYNGKKADARKLMAIMSLGVKKGEKVNVFVEGEEEEHTAIELEWFFNENL